MIDRVLFGVSSLAVVIWIYLWIGGYSSTPATAVVVIANAYIAVESGYRIHNGGASA